MKIALFLHDCSSSPEFGFEINGKIVPIKSVSEKAKIGEWRYQDLQSYLADLPGSEIFTRVLHDYASLHFGEFSSSEIYPPDEIHFLPPLRPKALFDFGLSPRHLKNSAMTLLRYEFSSFISGILGPFIKKKLDHKSKSGILPYYKGNHLEIIGDKDFTEWPAYTSYLDIEPELGILTGTREQPLAGYVIFNDMSARDIQFPEMIGTGPARCKDFSRSNGIGPYFVTSDEIPDPLNLEVSVSVGNRYQWHGSTSEYIHSPLEVIHYLGSLFPLVPGMLIGMGTIPDCTGLDRDQWLRPGDRICISFERMGTLHQNIPDKISIQESRWKKREDLKDVYRH